MADGREYLPVGTTLELDKGDIYKIAGAPIGCGGGSILYPAQKQFVQNGVLQTYRIMYALKECYPVSMGHSFTRSQNGEIIPTGKNEEDMHYLHQAQLRQLDEGNISQKIYRTATRVLPVRDSSQSVSLTLPGHATTVVPNTVTVMDSLAEKGRSLTTWIKERRRFTPAETFRIIQQLLFALREVHQAGYLHLDIQDGNVFLKGTLEDKDELVTLFDFGCAREMIDGKTAPIHDKVIFTTQGFSAPEILLHNDGSLQLGPEADIYSVGCLTLYLLTGQRANVRELIANRTGIYLKPNQLRRIKCPKHLVDTLQRILARALAKEPENRYHSTDDMLADVTGLVEALQPYRTDLSSVKYDAFICYMHGPVDSAAALALQRALENYRAPKGVCEKRRPFGRVFVDEGELSSCADFGQQIREALKNSGWLIVICSPGTPTSPWVQLEIDTFLENHDRSRILAVLTGGDVDASFPPRLKGDADGVGEVFAPHALSDTPQEAAKQLKGDALLKIAAPMLNTTFDTLKQRQKIYQLQRIAAVTAGFLVAVVGFAAYAVNRANVIAEQAVRIEEEYENALLNESRFLAEQAQKRLDDNDPLGTIELALQALPSAEQDRPILTEAEYVLGKALGIYSTPTSVEKTSAAVGVLEAKTSSFFLDDSGKYLFTEDETSEYIQTWDTSTLSLVQELMPGHDSGCSIRKDLIFSNANSLIAVQYDRLTCINYLSAEENWTVEINDLQGVSASADKTNLIVLSGKDASDVYFEGTQSESPFFEWSVDILSVDTGEKVTSCSLEMEKNQCLLDLYVSPDSKWVVLNTWEYDTWEYNNTRIESIYFVNLETGTCDLLLKTDTCITAIGFAYGNLTVMRCTDLTEGYGLNDATTTYTPYNSVYFESYSLETNKLIWQAEESGYLNTSGINTVSSVQYNTGQENGDGVLFTYSDRCLLLDQENGSAIQKYDLHATIIDIKYNANGFETINKDGSISVVDYGKLKSSNRPYWNGPISAVFRHEDEFYLQNNPTFGRDYRIKKYVMEQHDDSYEQHADLEGWDWNIYTTCTTSAGCRVILTRENQVCLVDTATDDIWIQDIPSQYSFSGYSCLGVSPDGIRLYWTQSQYSDDSWICMDIFMIDMYSGEVSEIPQPPMPKENLRVWDILFHDEKIVFVATQYLQEEHADGTVASTRLLFVYSWDIGKNELTELYKEEISSENYQSQSLQIDGDHHLYFAITAGNLDAVKRLVCIDTDNGERTSISLKFTTDKDMEEYSPWRKGCYQWNSTGTQMVFGYEKMIYVVNPDGELTCQIPVDVKPVAILFSPDESSIFVYTENHIITEYRIADGVCLSSIDLTEYTDNIYSSISPSDVKWQYVDESTLAVLSYSETIIMNISGHDISLKVKIKNCIEYDTRTDRYIIAESDFSGRKTVVGSFPRYSVDDLIRIANEILVS